jgi:hypothetical protein
MSYRGDCEKHDLACRETRRLWEVWQSTKKEEDFNKWWTASSLPAKKYLTINLKVWLEDGVDAEVFKMLLENGDTNIPFTNCGVLQGDVLLGEVIEGKASIWPKPCLG